jgi:hypothetical protein
MKYNLYEKVIFKTRITCGTKYNASKEQSEKVPKLTLSITIYCGFKVNVKSK